MPQDNKKTKNNAKNNKQQRLSKNKHKKWQEDNGNHRRKRHIPGRKKDNGPGQDNTKKDKAQRSNLNGESY